MNIEVPDNFVCEKKLCFRCSGGFWVFSAKHGELKQKLEWMCRQCSETLRIVGVFGDRE